MTPSDHRPTPARALGAAVLAVACVATPARGLQSARRAPADSPEPIQVVVANFTQGRSVPEFGRFGNFIAEVIDLELRGIPRLKVERLESTPVCRREVTGALPETPQVERRPTPDAPLYIVGGTVDVTAGGFETTYRVVECRAVRTASAVVYTMDELVRRRETFSWNAGLARVTGLAQHIGSMLQSRLPREAVWVEEFVVADSGIANAPVIADQLATVIADSVGGSSDLAIASPGTYRVGGRIEFAHADDRIGGLVAIQGRRGQAATEFPILQRPGERLDVFYRRVAAETMTWLSRVRVSEKLNVDFSTMTAETLGSEARALLCLDEIVDCDFDPDGAIALASTALSSDSTRWEAWWIIGVAELDRGDYLAALAALKRGRTVLAAARRAGMSVSDTSEARLLEAEGDAFDAVGNHGEAAARYGRAVELDPNRLGTRVALARSLRLSERPGDAWNAVMAAVERGFRINEFASELVQMLPDVPPAEIANRKDLVVDICSEEAAVRAECVDALVGIGRGIYDTGESPPTTRALFEIVLELTPEDIDARARALAFLAGSFVGQTSLTVKANDCVLWRSPEFDASAMDPHLRAAERAVSQANVPASTREWIARLRALYWARQQHFDRALAYLDTARMHMESDLGAYVAGETALSWATAVHEQSQGDCTPSDDLPPPVSQLYERAATLLRPLVLKRFQGADWYYRQAEHALQRDAQARTAFEQVLQTYPDDIGALRHLYFVCGEYLGERPGGYACAFEASQRVLELADVLALPDTLDAAEAALRVHELNVAGALLRGALAQTGVSARDLLITHVLRVWLAAARRRSDEVGAAFEEWKRSLARFRETGAYLEWTFEGSHGAVSRDRDMPACYRDLILAMFDTTEDETGALPLPAFAGCPTPPAP